MIEVKFENAIAEQVVAALESQIVDLASLVKSCDKAKQLEAVAAIKQDIAQLNTLKEEIEQEAGIGAPKIDFSTKKGGK